MSFRDSVKIILTNKKKDSVEKFLKAWEENQSIDDISDDMLISLEFINSSKSFPDDVKTSVMENLDEKYILTKNIKDILDSIKLLKRLLVFYDKFDKSNEFLMISSNMIEMDIKKLNSKIISNNLLNTGGSPSDLSFRDLLLLNKLRRYFMIYFPNSSHNFNRTNHLYEIGTALIGKVIPEKVELLLSKNGLESTPTLHEISSLMVKIKDLNKS